MIESSADLTAIAGATRDGFTGHEHLDNIGLIHMNGRVYDPGIGRFLSADPFVQDPASSQSFNRYSYTANNPATFVDPSGYAFCLSFSFGGGGYDDNSGFTVDFGFCDGQDYLVPGGGGVTGPQGLFAEPASRSITPSTLSAVGGTSTGQMLTEAFVPGTAYYNLGYAAEAQGRYLAAFGWHTAGHLEVLGTFATAGVGGVLVGTTRGATAAVRGSAAAYSVAFETTIAKVGAGTRPAHFAAANKNLAAAMNADAGFAKMMDDLAIKIPSEFGRSPAGWTWHHVPDQPGVMQLVPRAQHQGGPWQSILHPGGKGGFSLWGTDF